MLCFCWLMYLKWSVIFDSRPSFFIYLSFFDLGIRRGSVWCYKIDFIRFFWFWLTKASSTFISCFCCIILFIISYFSLSLISGFMELGWNNFWILASLLKKLVRSIMKFWLPPGFIGESWVSWLFSLEYWGRFCLRSTPFFIVDWVLFPDLKTGEVTLMSLKNIVFLRLLYFSGD